MTSNNNISYDLDYLYKVVTLYDSGLEVKEISEQLERSDQFIQNCLDHYLDNEDYYLSIFSEY